MPKKNIYRFKNRNNTKKNLKNKKNKKIISKKNKNLKNKIVRKKSIKNKNIKNKRKKFKIKQYGGSFLDGIIAGMQTLKTTRQLTPEQKKIKLCKRLVPEYQEFVDRWHNGNFILIKVHGCIDKSKKLPDGIPEPLLFNQGLTKDPSTDFPGFMTGDISRIQRFLRAQDSPIAPFYQDNDLLLSIKFKDEKCNTHDSNDFWYSLWYSNQAYVSARQKPSLNYERSQPGLLPGPIFTDAEYLYNIIDKIPLETKKQGYTVDDKYKVQFSYSDLISTLKTQNYISDTTNVYLLCCTNDCPAEPEYSLNSRGAFSLQMEGAGDGMGAFSPKLITDPFQYEMEKSRRYIHSSSPGSSPGKVQRRISGKPRKRGSYPY